MPRRWEASTLWTVGPGALYDGPVSSRTKHATATARWPWLGARSKVRRPLIPSRARFTHERCFVFERDLIVSKLAFPTDWISEPWRQLLERMLQKYAEVRTKASYNYVPSTVVVDCKQFTNDSSKPSQCSCFRIGQKPAPLFSHLSWSPRGAARGSVPSKVSRTSRRRKNRRKLREYLNHLTPGGWHCLSTFVPKLKKTQSLVWEKP